MTRKTRLAVLVGNRGFFPDHLCDEGRQTVLGVLKQEGIEGVCPASEDIGSVETYQQARRWADIIKQPSGDGPIDGVLVTLPNFGGERGIADALRLADLGVPVLVHAFPDDPAKMSLAGRRDSFCGKMSACNNLRQYGIDYTLTSLHTMDPTSEAFRADLRQFAATCRVVAGLKNARIGAIGARPADFNTVRFSEKLLEGSSISTVPVDLSEIFGQMTALADGDDAVQERLAAIRGYIPTGEAPDGKLVQMAKLAAVIDAWMNENELTAAAMQCWTSIEQYMGIVPCTVMSMMSERLIPCGCEVDVTGVVGMLALSLASTTPGALLDWNNNYGDDPDMCALFHCSNLPRSMFSCPTMGVQDIIGGSVGIDNTWGTCTGRLALGPFTFLRVSTDDTHGRIVGYVGEGELTDDALETFGGFGTARIQKLQKLLNFICRYGLEHHVAVTSGLVAKAVHEALIGYLGWSIMHHNAPEE